MFLKTCNALLFWLKICCRPEIPSYWWRNVKCFSSILPLISRSSSLARRQIVNPHCEAASGRALGPYFRGQIHHVWCGWCSHNSSLTGVMFAGIIQHSINTRAWKKYGGFIKTVNRKSKKKTRRLSLTSRYAFLLLMPSADDRENAIQKQQRGANLLKLVKMSHLRFFLNQKSDYSHF